MDGQRGVRGGCDEDASELLGDEADVVDRLLVSRVRVDALPHVFRRLLPHGECASVRRHGEEVAEAGMGPRDTQWRPAGAVGGQR